MTETLETTIRDVIVAAQVEATAVPLREYDEVTVNGLQEVIEVPAFKGFDDFELDLSCLSPPPSPPTSISELPRSNSSRPSSPSAHSISFSLTSESPSKDASPKRHGRGGAAARGSWPLVRYVGRGTPIDRSRRIEWGAAGSEEVGEDGVLFSEVRSTSLDSAIRPSQRSVSPDWNFLSSRPLGRRSSTLPPRRSNSRMFAPAPAVETPEIKIEGLGSENPEEWTSFMQTVLGSAESASASTSKLEDTAPEPTSGDAQEPERPKETFRPAHDAPLAPTMSPEEMQQLSNGLEMDLDIGAALDLGLGVGDGGTHMNYFNLGLLPESGRESPSSVYSSPPPSPRASSPPTPSISDNRSATSTKAEAGVGLEAKSVPQPWWRRVLGRFRRIHSLLASH